MNETNFPERKFSQFDSRISEHLNHLDWEPYWPEKIFTFYGNYDWAGVMSHALQLIVGNAMGKITWSLPKLSKTEVSINQKIIEFGVLRLVLLKRTPSILSYRMSKPKHLAETKWNQTYIHGEKTNLYFFQSPIFLICRSPATKTPAFLSNEP